MAFLSTIFERLRRKRGKKGEEEGREKQGQEKRRAERGRRAFRQNFATVVITTLLVVQLMSAPAAGAFGLGDITGAIHSVVSTASDVVNTIRHNNVGAITGALGGIYFGAKTGALIGGTIGSIVPGPGTAAGAAIGAVVGAIAGGIMGAYAGAKGEQIVKDFINGDKDNSANIMNSNQNATTDDLSKNNDLLKNYQLVDDATSKASGELTELLSKLATKPTEYSLQMQGATGNIQLKFFGPDEIRGFSAFPVKLRIVTAADPIEKNVIHLNKVTMYVIRQDTGTAYYTYQKVFGPNETSLNGDAYTITTFLKVPDDLDTEVINALQTGQITQDLINELKNAKTPSFEIYIRVDATKEDWDYVNGTWKHVRDIPLTVEAQTVSAYTHVTHDNDVVLFQTGLNASLPSDMANLVMGKFSAFIAEQWGGVSDIVIRPYATPVHVANSTVTWQFYVAPNTGFYTMFDSSPQVYDDFEVFAVRVLQGGRYEIADRRANQLGDLTDGAVKKAYGVTKYTFGPDIVNYRVYGLGLIWFQRDDGTKIPVWVLVQPHMTVLDPEKLALDDARIQRILPIFDDNKITSMELQTLKAELETAKQDIQEKIRAMQELKKMAEANGNSEAAQYAERAIKYYQLELQMLDQAAQTQDAQLALNYLNAAKKYEYAADFEGQAAQKANNGDLEGARYLDGQAQEYKKTADDYLPHFSPGGFVNSILSNLTNWKYLLLLAVLVIGGFYVFGRMGALIGLGIWLAIVIGIPALKGLIIWLKAKL